MLTKLATFESANVGAEITLEYKLDGCSDAITGSASRA